MLSLYGQTAATLCDHVSAWAFWWWAWMQDGTWWGS